MLSSRSLVSIGSKELLICFSWRPQGFQSSLILTILTLDFPPPPQNIHRPTPIPPQRPSAQNMLSLVATNKVPDRAGNFCRRWRAR